ncbi:MAG TPA: hypothetical protein VF335_10455, partial [Chitinivibrionales bacterium]
TLRETVGAGVQLLDSAFWTAREAKDMCTAMNIRNPEARGGKDRSKFFVTDMTDSFRENASAFLGSGLPNLEKINLEQLTAYTT